MGLGKDIDIENYKELLFAILNTDEDKGKRKAICVYDTQQNDKLVAVFNTTDSCGKFFKTSGGSIRTAIARKTLRSDRFKIEKIVIEGE